MRKRRAELIFPLFVIGAIILSVSDADAQRYTRSKSLGVNGSFWNLRNSLTGLDLSGSNTDISLNLSGLGGMIYFTSRASDRWYFDFAFGGVVDLRVRETQVSDSDVDFEGIVPLSFGLRYNILSPLHPSPFRPYISGGGGPYWLARGAVVSDTLMGTEDFQIQSRYNLGYYFGGGVSMYLSSWLSLDFDFKRHFINFQAEGVEGVEVDDYSGFQFGLGFSVHWGNKKEIFRVKGTTVLTPELYPAYYTFYRTYPVALVAVQNVSGHAIEINVRAGIQRYSDRYMESGFVKLRKGETKDIPVTVILGRRFLRSDRREPAALDIHVEARVGGKHRKSLSAQIIVHNRNAWDGEIEKLGLFVTPDEDEILDRSRRVARRLPEDFDPRLRKFEIARRLFEEIQQEGIRYHSDPNIPYYQDDRVQFALETLDLATGDCDDLVVLYSSLLESAGIRTAFVDVENPEKSIAHLYLMFDTNLPPEQGDLISSNEKKYVIRENRKGQRTVWIPVETTFLRNGFDQAWQNGALQYLEEGLLRDGVEAGWVRVIDVK